MLSEQICKCVQSGAVLAYFEQLGLTYCGSVGFFLRIFIIKISEAIFALRLFVRFLFFKLTPFISVAVLRFRLIEVPKTNNFVVDL
jgi:hypothetical protein